VWRFDLTETSLIWKFDVFIAGSQTPRSHVVYADLKRICCEYLGNRYTINVFDIEKNPQCAVDNQITATRHNHPQVFAPQKTLIGYLTNLALVASKL
jgi:hypothetical protein